MFYDEYGMAFFYERIQCVQEFADVVEVQPCGRFVENKEDMLAGIFTPQKSRQLYPLRLAAG
ncbi:MAG: hypothetical protein R2795_15680 [Saprospiraceae bacterium]